MESCWSSILKGCEKRLSLKKDGCFKGYFSLKCLNLGWLQAWSLSQASESTQIVWNKGVFSFINSLTFDDQLSLNFHRSVLLSICSDTPSEKTCLWQLPNVSSNLINIFVMMIIHYQLALWKQLDDVSLDCDIFPATNVPKAPVTKPSLLQQGSLNRRVVQANRSLKLVKPGQHGSMVLAKKPQPVKAVAKGAKVASTEETPKKTVTAGKVLKEYSSIVSRKLFESCSLRVDLQKHSLFWRL